MFFKSPYKLKSEVKPLVNVCDFKGQLFCESLSENISEQTTSWRNIADIIDKVEENSKAGLGYKILSQAVPSPDLQPQMADRERGRRKTWLYHLIT